MGGDRFAERGWSGPHRLMPATQANALGQIAERCMSLVSDPSTWWDRPPDFGARPWYKSLHGHVPAFHDLARHPVLVEAVTARLGPDVLAWGVSGMRKAPGERHPWHIDVEHIKWPGVSIFLGLSGTVPQRSGLKFIGGSHRLPAPQWGLDDEGALAHARAARPDCTLDYPPLGDGEFLLFDGPVWHASHNSGDGVRVAAILQYCAPSARVRIPLSFGEPPVWHDARPPCTLVAGNDRFGVNRIVGRPGSHGTQAG